MRLLVVEDEPKMAALLRDGLAAEGHMVTLAATGDEGLDVASGLDFEAIILDRMLPVMDGCEVARRLRRSGKTTPILMLTARDAEGDVVSGLDVGVDDYLTKPFAFAVLNARIRALGRRPPLIAPRVLRFRDLELDLDNVALRQGGRTIALTRTEFRILEEMMLHPDRVHRRETLVQRVWGYDTEVESNTLEVYICHLRNKLDDGRGVRQIQTIRGVGYRLSPKPL